MPSDPVTAALISSGTSLGLGAMGAGASKTQGQWNRRLIRKENQLAREHQLGLVTLGNEMDMANQKEMFDYRIQQGKAAGMTDYEMFMGPAAGAGGGTTGSGNTLGNQPAQLAANAVAGANARMAAQTAVTQSMINAGTEIQKAKIGADAQKYSADQSSGATTQAAETSAAASMYNSDVQSKIAANQLKFNEKRYRTIDLPQAQMNLKISKEQLAKAINEAATSEPTFQIYMQKLRMGLDNQISEYVQGAFGFDVTKPKTFPRDFQKRKELLGFLIAIQSGTLRNAEGLKALLGQAQDSSMGFVENAINNFTLGNVPWKKRSVIQVGPRQ
jgi:hypothetical protein